MVAPLQPTNPAPDAGAYAARHINPTLTRGLVALCRERPADPVAWLAGWLHANKPEPQTDEAKATRRAAKEAARVDLAERLLDALADEAAATPPVHLPVTPHAERLPSGMRGVSWLGSQ